MDYQVVFDVSRNGGHLAIWAIPPLFVLIFGLIGWGLKDSNDPQLALKGAIFMIFCAVGLVFSLVFFVSSCTEFLRAKSVLSSGQYRVTEGTVTDFVPMPPGGHSIEHFKVGNVFFQYGSGWGSVAFNSEWNRDFIHNGEHLRITSNTNGDILRIETK